MAWGSGGLCTLIKHCKKNGYGGMGMKHLIYCGGLCPHYRSFNLIIFLITDYWFDLFFFFFIFFDLIYMIEPEIFMIYWMDFESEILLFCMEWRVLSGCEISIYCFLYMKKDTENRYFDMVIMFFFFLNKNSCVFHYFLGGKMGFCP